MVEGMFFNNRDLPPWIRDAGITAFLPATLYNFTRIFNYQLRTQGASLLTRIALFGMAKYFQGMLSESVAGVSDEEREALKAAGKMPSRLTSILLPWRGKDGRLLSVSIAGFLPYISELRYLTGGETSFRTLATALSPLILRPAVATAVGLDAYGGERSKREGINEKHWFLDFAESSISLAGPMAVMSRNLWNEGKKKAEEADPAGYNLMGALGWRVNDTRVMKVIEQNIGKSVGEVMKTIRSMRGAARSEGRGNITESALKGKLEEGNKQLEKRLKELDKWSEREGKVRASTRKRSEK
jgi:hypothetical protein